jgi:membrane-anchored protein YejM (alkaline phosphatase superfamily)
MDRSIGRVLDQLERSGIADNTIVVFLNDNGGGESTERYAWHSRNYANNLPLRGYKFDVLEGGVRVPMIIRWPGQNLKGKVYSEMVSSFDLFPTLLQAAGLEMPEKQHTDGVDLLPYIKGGSWFARRNLLTRTIHLPGNCLIFQRTLAKETTWPTLIRKSLENWISSLAPGDPQCTRASNSKNKDTINL